MNARNPLTVAAMLALLSAAGAWARPDVQPPAAAKPAEAADQEGAEDGEEVIDLANAPEAVRLAAIKLAGGEKAITKVTKEQDDGAYTYEIEYAADGVECSAVFSSAGDVMEIEKGTVESRLPAAVAAALKKRFPGATFEKAVSVTKMYFEVQVVAGDKKREVLVDASGAVKDTHAGAHDEGAKNPGHAAGGDEFRREFVVDKASLSATGANPYFDLTPGTVSTFKEGKTTLTITVLNDTRVVDGVTTRIIEEREEVGGKPKEISRNYFAIDRTAGDVYYFGEDVDEFDDAGKVSHPGAWLSGVNGARFGLMIPGSPKAGDKFHQELAPGVAMDRFEIVGVDETVQTPAGKFEHCVHVVETTPLEKDVGHKWYAPGMGLIKDGHAELVSVKRPGR